MMIFEVAYVCPDYSDLYYEVQRITVRGKTAYRSTGEFSDVHRVMLSQSDWSRVIRWQGVLD